MIGTGYLSGNNNDNDGGWFNKFWNSDNNWFKKSWDDSNFNKFMGFMSAGGSDKDKCDCEDRKKDHKEHYDGYKKYYDDNKNKFGKGDYKKYLDDYKKYFDDNKKGFDKTDFKQYMDYYKKFLDDNKKHFSYNDYKKYSDEYKKYSDEYPKHDDHCTCMPDRDEKPLVDHALISFNIAQRELKDSDEGPVYFQNIVDQCIFESEESFAPLCIKCKFLTMDGSTVLAKGEVVELDQSYTANQEVVIPMSPVPWAAPYAPVANDVQDVDKVELTLCGEKCVPVFADFTNLKHGARESLINTALASQGISVSGIGNNGPSEVIIFDADKTGTMDPDLQVKNGFHLLILPEKGTLNDANNDGYVDNPNDAAAGGTITITLSASKYLKSFVLVDHENDHPSDQAIAYSDIAGLNPVKTVKLPKTGDGKFTTVTMNAENVMRLDVNYADSGGITNLDLKCSPPEQNCSCEKPDKFTVTYNNGPSDVTVKILTKEKGTITLGKFSPGQDIMVDADALQFKNGKVEPNTTYQFFDKWSKSVGTITIHTSCSQTLYIGQMFFYNQGNAGEIKLTVKDGTIDGKTSIPDESCPVPPPTCDCDDKKDHYDKYYDNHKKYYDDNKYKFKNSDYKNYMDEHEKYLNDYGKYMDKSEYKKHTDYFKKFLDDHKSKFSNSDYKKYSDDYKKYSNDYKNHDDSCKCGDHHDDDSKDHYDKDDRDKDDKHKDDKNSKDYKYKYGKDHDD